MAFCIVTKCFFCGKLLYSVRRVYHLKLPPWFSSVLHYLQFAQTVGKYAALDQPSWHHLVPLTNKRWCTTFQISVIYYCHADVQKYWKHCHVVPCLRCYFPMMAPCTCSFNCCPRWHLANKCLETWDLQRSRRGDSHHHNTTVVIFKVVLYGVVVGNYLHTPLPPPHPHTKVLCEQTSVNLSTWCGKW